VLTEADVVVPSLHGLTVEAARLIGN